MSFKISYDPEIHCVVTSIAGDMDKDLVTGFFAEVGKVAAANNCTRILSDLREARIVASITHMYEMVKEMQKLKIPKSFKRAVVISNDHSDYNFWETASYNQGYQFVKIFEDYNEAMEWVLSNDQ